MNAKELLEALIEERDFCKKMLNSKGYVVTLFLDVTAHYNSDGDVAIAHLASKTKVMTKTDAEKMLNETFTTTKKGVIVPVYPKLEKAKIWFAKRYVDYDKTVELVKNNI